MLQLNKTSSEIEEKAKIYGKAGKTPTAYQVAINNAAVDLAEGNPDVVFDNGRCNFCIYHRHAFLNMKTQNLYRVHYLFCCSCNNAIVG